MALSQLGWEVDPTVEAILGGAGTVSAILMFLSPIGTFRRIITNRSTEEFSPFPYVSTLLNCTVWIFYALPFITPNRGAPLFTNLVGIVIQALFIGIFLKYAQGKTRLSAYRLLLVYLSLSSVLALGVMLAVAPPNRSPVVGFFAVIFTVIMFGSPLAALSVVLRSHSVEFMPLPLSLMALACSAIWTAYGVYVKDTVIVLPNILGMLLGVVQIGIYSYISCTPRKALYQAAAPSQEDQEAPLVGDVESSIEMTSVKHDE